jgi:hypothetical protein
MMIYTWDSIILGYESMYKTTKDSENEGTRSFADHAMGMLSLIPRIQHFDEFRDIELNLSLGALVCSSKTKKGGIRISCKKNFIYVLHIYENGIVESKELNSSEVVAALHEHLKRITST